MTSEMTDNGQGFTVKELLVGLTAKVDSLIATTSQQYLTTQQQISDLRVDLATHKALPAHPDAAAQLITIQTALGALANADSTQAGEKAGSLRTWKLIATVAGIPGIAALAAQFLVK